MEKDVGSIVPGELANLTVLGGNPVACDAARIKDIPVIATVHEGRVFESKLEGRSRTGKKSVSLRSPEAVAPDRWSEPAQAIHDHGGRGSGCACATGKVLAGLLFSGNAPEHR